MLIARTRMQQLKQSHQLQQQSNQMVGALSLILSCLGISAHPSGSRQGHPRYIGARSAGRPWVARTQFSTADHSVKNTPNMVAEQCRSRARALPTRALLTRVCCFTEDPETKKSMRRSTRTSKRTLTSSENKTTFETHYEIDEYFYSVRTHAGYAERVSMENLHRAISVEKLGL